jgi:hypothetical protein
MPHAGRALSIGVSAARALSAGRAGEVVAVFSRAAYLDLADELVVLVPKDVPNGPLHVRLERLPQLVRGTRVQCSSGALVVGDHRWATPAEPWRAASPSDVLSAGPLVSTVVRHRPVLDMAAGGAVDIEDWLVPLLAAGDIEGACARLFGSGAGLTPSGDDVAAGILLVMALAGSADPARLAALAASAPTHAISRAFLRAAAQGQCIEPIHTLLLAASAGDEGLAHESMDRLARVGHTSGMDLAAGAQAALLALAPPGAMDRARPARCDQHDRPQGAVGHYEHGALGGAGRPPRVLRGL